MENKYYTPELEEFHIGFEYELMKPDSKFHKRIFGIHKIVHPELDQFNDDLDKIAHAITRVKYLDKEDLESLDFKYNGTHTQSNIGFFTCNHLFIEINFNNSFLKIINQKTDSVESNDKWLHEYLFQGYIKNKSELKRLLKQIIK